MAERKITVVVDVVQSGSGPAKVKATIGGVEREVKDSQKRITDSAKRYNKIIEDSDKAQARIKKVLAKQQADDFIRELRRVEAERKRVEQSAQKSGGVFGATFAGSFLGNIGANAVSGLTSQLSSAASAVFDFSSKMKQSQIGFATLMKSSTLAAQHIKELQKLTTDFPLDFGSIAKMSQRLQGAGIEAKKIVPLIKDIGNIAAATGDLSAERLEGIAVALSQIASKGRVSAEEMEQLAERGVPAWRMLSEWMGKSVAVTRKMAEEGKITSDQLFAAYQRFSRMNFGKAMENQAKTFSGAMMQIKNVLLLTANTAFKPFMDKISKLAFDTSTELKKQSKDWESIGYTLGHSMGQAAGIAFAEAVGKFPSIAAGAIKGGGKGLWQGGVDVGIDAAEWFNRNVTEKGLNMIGRRGDPAATRRYMDQLTKGAGWGAVGPAPFSAGQVGTPIDYTRPDYEKQKQKREELDQKWKDSLSGISSILSAMREGTMMQESGGRSRARNARTDASGLFQVMPANIGPWTKAALGQSMSQNDFLSSSRAQEAVFNHVMGQYLETAMKLSGGNKDVAIRMAAAAWYGGPGAMKRYDDPTKFRKNEPSFREYTQGVLNKTRTSKLGDTIGIGDVQDELKAKMEGISDAKSEQARKDMATVAFNLFRITGMVPSKEMLDTLHQMFIDEAKRLGTVQPTSDSMKRMVDSIRLGRAPITMNDYGLPSVSDTQSRPLEDHTEQIDATNRILDEQREKILDWEKRVLSEIENLKREEYQKTRDMIEESLDYLSRGDLKGLGKSLMERSRREFVEKGTDFILDKLGIENPDNTPELKEAKKQTQLLSQIARGVGMPGTTGLGSSLTSTVSGLFSGMGPGGTAMFNGGTFAGSASGIMGGGAGGASAGIGGSSGGGILSGLTGAGGMFGPVKNLLTGRMSSMGGIMGGIGSAASMAGGMIGGRWGNLISMAGMGAQMGASFGPWGAAIGAGIGGVAGLVMALMGRDNAIKKLKQAALSTYGITVKDKDVLKSLQQLGETMFGKGKAGANAQAIVSSDQGQTILRNYAEATGQSTKMMDRLYYGDENWSGNQVRSGFSGFGASSRPETKFGGFRAMGGHVSAGMSYVVGEHRAEMFTPSTSGYISPTVGMGDQQMKVILGQLEETVNMLATRLNSLSPGQVLSMGAAENPAVIGDAMVGQSNRQDVADAQQRATGRAF